MATSRDGEMHHMTMTAEQCRARATECMDLAEMMPERRVELLNMADRWLELAREALELSSRAAQGGQPQKTASTGWNQ